jgi:nucleoside-diphosphate-sugar epimerase
MNIFLTGGTGFIGSYFINQAHKAGHELICIRRPGSQPRIHLEKEPVWVEGLLNDDWRREMKDCEVLLHLAAHSTNVPYDTLENCLYWNVTASLKLFQSALESGIIKFLVAGTCFEYGESGENFSKIPADAALLPTMSYPASKAAASIVFYQWAVENVIRLQYLRIFQVFGEGENENRLWPSLKRAAFAGEDVDLTEGGQIRDFLPVEEAANQFLKALNFEGVECGKPLIKNMGTGKPQSIKCFAESWWKKWGAKGNLNFGSIPYRKNEIMSYIPLISVK